MTTHENPYKMATPPDSTTHRHDVSHSPDEESTSPGCKRDGLLDDENERSKKRRITRACDLCNKRRVKCDGQQPCSRCAGHDVCEYQRAVYKRGKPSRSALLERQNGHKQEAAPAPPVPAPVQAPVQQQQPPPQQQHTQPPPPSVVSITANSGIADQTQQSSAYARHSSFGTDHGMQSFMHRPSMGERHPSTVTLDSSANMWNGRYSIDLGTAAFNASMAAPVFGAEDNTSETNSGNAGHPKYPVLVPLLPYVASILTESQAASLLELYFTSQFNTFMHPVCRHIHAFVFRKASVMSKDNPRNCSPALLASMLWAAAETGGPETLSWSHSKRINICRKLRLVTIRLLHPLVHSDIGCVHELTDGPTRKLQESSSGTLDDVITYIHIAAITSASEEKAMSMRWWHAAFALARELGLNKEPISGSSIPGVSPTANNQSMIEFESDPWLGLNSFDFDNGLAQYMDAADTTQPEVDQETLEERRRTWWLLYIQDRHLALCYNRQNALLDAECEDLLLPLDEASWQSGNFSSLTQRPQFPSFECTGHNIYGWFLPLMTIVGTILDYNHLKNHHTLGKLYTDGQRVQSQVLLQLDNYAQSLVRFEQQASAMDYQDIHHTKTVVAYANLVIQVSRVLLAGKWDPMSLFDDRDLFMATPSFTTTIANAIAAADNVSHILDVDPDLGFVPYFLGIQLLQGSLPLLLIVDRLQTETDPKIINACEVIIRATEACVSTLDTEYQVSLLHSLLYNRNTDIFLSDSAITAKFSAPQSHKHEVATYHRKKHNTDDTPSSHYTAGRRTAQALRCDSKKESRRRNTQVAPIRKITTFWGRFGSRTILARNRAIAIKAAGCRHTHIFGLLAAD
jgi:hypothetical protein